MLLNLFVGVLIFFIGVFIHECVHLLMARFYGFKANFRWIPAKEKQSFGFGYFPGVRIYYSEKLTKKKGFMIMIFPIVPTTILFTISVMFICWCPEKMFLWIFLSSIVGVVSSFIGSKHDIKDYINYSFHS